MNHQTEKTLFLVVCALFAISAVAFAIMLTTSQPAVIIPTKQLPGKPVIETRNQVPLRNETAVQTPPQEFSMYAASTTDAEWGKAQALVGQGEPTDSAIPTGSITVNVVNGRNSPKPLRCRLAREQSQLYQVEAKDGLCLFYDLAGGNYVIELNDGVTVIDQQAINLAAGQKVSIVLMAKNAKTFCRDSDNGMAYDQFGITMDQFGNEFSDLCISDRIVREFYCEDNQLKQSDTTCNTACMGGVCK